MKKGTLSIALGLLLISAAILLTSYNLWDNHRAGQAADNVLKEIIPMIDTDPIPKEGRITASLSDVENSSADYISNEVEYPDYVLNPGMEMPVKNIDGVGYIGVISIPSIECELPVCNEWNYSNLRIAPCRYTGTAYLNDMVICAHNYDYHFGSLKYLSYGDTVIFTDMDGNVFDYKVTEIETLSSYSIDEMTTGEWDLTLFTCTLGGATRVAVRCKRA